MPCISNIVIMFRELISFEDYLGNPSYRAKRKVSRIAIASCADDKAATKVRCFYAVMNLTVTYSPV